MKEKVEQKLSLMQLNVQRSIQEETKGYVSQDVVNRLQLDMKDVARIGSQAQSELLTKLDS